MSLLTMLFVVIATAASQMIKNALKSEVEMFQRPE